MKQLQSVLLPMTRPTRTAAAWVAVGLSLGLAACGTTSNRPVQRPAVADAAPDAAQAAPAATGATDPEQPQAGTSGGTQVAGQETGSQTQPGPTVAAPAAVAGPVTLAKVADGRVTTEDLLARWLHRDSNTVRRFLEELILERLVDVESQRMGIEIDPAKLSADVKNAVEIIEREISKGGSAMELDEFVRRRLALDPVSYRASLREEQRLDLLAARCVRAWLLRNDHVRVETLVVGQRSQVDEILAAVGRGEDFADLVRTYGLDPLEDDKPRVHHVVKAPSPMSRLAFNTAVGDVGGPIDQGGRFLLLRVLARTKALEGSWEEIGPEVEASLRERAIEDPEYWQWKDAMLERYPVDMSPFLEAMPEAAG